MGFFQPTAQRFTYPILGYGGQWYTPIIPTHGWLWSPYLPFRHRRRPDEVDQMVLEDQVLSGKNADFHRQDLWDAIESGNGPEWELGVQIMEESDQLRFGFDLLDPTKIVPEELVPVQRIGKLTLNQNPRNFFAETEQVMVGLTRSKKARTARLTLFFLVPTCSHCPRH
jgi:hypothetical protein